MSKSYTTTTPSGMKVRLRGLRGREINLFANADEARQRQIGYDLLKAVVEEIVDPGPAYPEIKAGPPEDMDWKKLLSGDRFWLYLHTRIATYGSGYAFRCQCPECDHKMEWGLDLGELPSVPYSQEAIAGFSDKNRLGPIEVDGRLVEFSLMTGALEDHGLSMQKRHPEDASTVVIANRIASVDGEENGKEIHEWILDLQMGDLLDLGEEMQAHDGGIETDVDVKCFKCRTEWTVSLPLGGDFWTPSKQGRSIAKKEVKIPTGGGPILQK